jgi:glycosyltransferase involved in cell wall biosynthesis
MEECDTLQTCDSQVLSAVNTDEEQARVVYLVRREGLSAVFKSQVLGRMSKVAELGYPVEVAVFKPLGQWIRPALRHQWQEVIRSAPAALAGRVKSLPSFPSRIDWPEAEAHYLKWWLRMRFGRSQPVILQCRNATTSGMALQVKRSLPQVKVIYDCRGIESEELLYMQGASYTNASENLRQTVDWFDNQQRTAARNADGIVCVSHAMVEYISAKNGVSTDKCLVMPCCPDVDRFESAAVRRLEMRRKLKLEDRFVVAYCGSLKSWQLPDHCLNLFLRLRAIEPTSHFLAITTQPQAMQEMADKLSIPFDRMTVVSVPHDEVPAYLAAADAGLLLREKSPVNQVASPVKFGEYLASGTPVIMSDGIGDYSELTQRENVGLVLPTDASEADIDAGLKTFLDEYRSDPESWQTRCRRVAREHLDSDVHLPKIIKLYERLSPWR